MNIRSSPRTVDPAGADVAAGHSGVVRWRLGRARGRGGKLTPNHGTLRTKTVPTTEEIVPVIVAWHPHFVPLDVDIADERLVRHAATTLRSAGRIPPVARTGRARTGTTW
jgi:hypothetical protein